MIGKMTRDLKGRNMVSSLPKTCYKSLGGVYWKVLPSSQKLVYLKLAELLIEEDNTDYHVGDADFQQIVIAGVGKLITAVKDTYSDYYLNGEVFSFPKDIVEGIEKPTSIYNPGMLMEYIGRFIYDESNPDSVARRYVFEENPEKEKLEEKRGKPKSLPLHPEAKDIIYGLYSQIWFGIEKLGELDEAKQEELILHCLISGTNIGWPFFIHQTPENFKKLLWQAFDLVGFKPKVEFICVKLAISLIKYLYNKKIAPPYTLFYRVQPDKVRTVYGGHIFQKLLAALFHAAKQYGFTKDACDTLGLKYHDTEYDKFDLSPSHNDFGDKEESTSTKIVSRGGVPYMPQLNWDVVFNLLKDKLPPLGEDMKPKILTPLEIQKLYGVTANGDMELNVYGEDLKSYDSGIIYEDVKWLEDHPKMGFIFKYLFMDLLKSDVWFGGLRFKGIFFKSGMFLTSNIGSDNHLNYQFNFRDEIRKTEDPNCEIMWVTDQSDDDLICMTNVNHYADKMNKYLKNIGMAIKAAESYDFNRDKIVCFLKVYLGYVLRTGGLAFIGDPQSRYYGLAHSERPIEGEIENPLKIKGDLKGVWQVTGKVQIDAVISKLASLGIAGQNLVFKILDIIKDTTFGKDILNAISMIDPNRAYHLYREDVAFGFNPSWLGNLRNDVLMLLNGHK